ncbi:MAG: hypothetical protein QOG48_1904 [Verrucomicrobiota bacterium]|jgi:hypothetical protein
MKKAFIAANFKTIFSLAAGVSLVSGFWIASAPVAKAVQRTPAEIIQAELPSDMTIATASDRQLLDAVCKSVKRSPSEAGLIVRTAAGARQKIRSDVLCMAVKCARTTNDDIKGTKCTWVVDVVRDWIKQDPNLASQLTESVSQCSPTCRDTLQVALVEGKDAPAEGPGNFEGGNVMNNLNPPPGSSGGGGLAQESKCVVCHNGHEISIPCETAQKHLQQHSGDTLGACQATPVTNP